MTNSRGCEHEDTNVETASNRLNGVADPEGATLLLLISRFLISLSLSPSLPLSLSLLVRRYLQCVTKQIRLKFTKNKSEKNKIKYRNKHVR